jgi:hypothetical protein
MDYGEGEYPWEGLDSALLISAVLARPTSWPGERQTRALLRASFASFELAKLREGLKTSAIDCWQSLNLVGRGPIFMADTTASFPYSE